MKGYYIMKDFIGIACCAAGGVMVGFFANRLDTVVGCVCFTLGVVLLVGAGVSLSKKGKEN